MSFNIARTGRFFGPTGDFLSISQNQDTSNVVSKFHGRIIYKLSLNRSKARFFYFEKISGPRFIKKDNGYYSIEVDTSRPNGSNPTVHYISFQPNLFDKIVFNFLKLFGIK